MTMMITSKILNLLFSGREVIISPHGLVLEESQNSNDAFFFFSNDAFKVN